VKVDPVAAVGVIVCPVGSISEASPAAVADRTDKVDRTAKENLEFE
jgi:hypothetical protein